MVFSQESVELVVAIVVGILSKVGYDKVKHIFSNGGSPLTREAHERECSLKLKPITDTLTRIEGHVEKISNKHETGHVS
jgi:hypothetical protein